MNENNDKDFEGIDQPFNDNVEESENVSSDESFVSAQGYYDDSGFVFDDVAAQSVNIPGAKISDGSEHKGIRLFCALLTIFFVAVCCTFAGFYFGRSTTSVSDKENNDSALMSDKNVNGLAAADIYSRVSASVVGILVYNEAEEPKMSEASGVVYTSDGYIITNDHIYSLVPSAKFKVYTSDGASYSAVYIAGDTRSDLAILKITDKVNLKAAEFSDSDLVKSGDYVCAIGCPNGYNSKSTITLGVVSVPKVRIANSSNYASNLIQTDSAINPGNSGGVLVNLKGQVIGITSSKVAQTAYEGIGYAIPTKTVKKIVGSLMEYGKVTNRAKLGITYRFYSGVIADLSGMPSAGLEIAEVLPECKVLGTLNSGDIITHADGIELTNDAILLDILEDRAPGDNIVLTVMRNNGTIENVTVKLIADQGSSSYSVN